MVLVVYGAGVVGEFWVVWLFQVFVETGYSSFHSSFGGIVSLCYYYCYRCINWNSYIPYQVLPSPSAQPCGQSNIMGNPFALQDPEVLNHGETSAGSTGTLSFWCWKSHRFVICHTFCWENWWWKLISDAIGTVSFWFWKIRRLVCIVLHVLLEIYLTRFLWRLAL